MTSGDGIECQRTASVRHLPIVDRNAGKSSIEPSGTTAAEIRVDRSTDAELGKLTGVDLDAVTIEIRNAHGCSLQVARINHNSSKVL